MSTRSLLRPGILAAAIVIVDTMRRRLLTDAQQAVNELQYGPSTVTSLPLQDGATLVALVGQEAFGSLTERDLRQVIAGVLDVELPLWLNAAERGREWCVRLLEEDTAQVLRDQGLLESVPDEDCLRWWDALAARARSLSQSQRADAGRAGERLTLALEADRLKQQGLEHLSLRWIGVEDSRFGCDVLSWRLRGGQPTPVFIEVKAFARGNARFFISRAEWEFACQHASEWELHIWDLEATALRQVMLQNGLMAHVPQDHGNGRWDVVAVTLTGSVTPGVQMGSNSMDSPTCRT